MFARIIMKIGTADKRLVQKSCIRKVIATCSPSFPQISPCGDFYVVRGVSPSREGLTAYRFSASAYYYSAKLGLSLLDMETEKYGYVYPVDMSCQRCMGG